MIYPARSSTQLTTTCRRLSDDVVAYLHLPTARPASLNTLNRNKYRRATQPIAAKLELLDTRGAHAHQLLLLHERSDHPDAVLDRHPPRELGRRELVSREPARLGSSFHVLPPLEAPRRELLRAAPDQALPDL